MKSFNSNTINNDIWLTPRWIINSLGEFDLDPCSPINRPWDTAKFHFTESDNGLLQDWKNYRVWLNPPYGRQLEAWLNRMALHSNGLALIFARTETRAFQQYIFPYAHSILFLSGRVKFCNIKGIPQHNANAPSLIISYTEYDSEMIAKSGIKGFHAALKPDFFIIGIAQEENKSWKIIVGDALERLNNKACLSDIYNAVLKLAPSKINNNRFYKEKIRQVLQSHFHHVDTGVWSKVNN